jgi:hypothetical protein
MMNMQLGESALADEVLDSVYEMWWPEFDAKVRAILKQPGPAASSAVRPERDILEEILELSRLGAAMSSRDEVDPTTVSSLVHWYIRLASGATRGGKWSGLEIDTLIVMGDSIEYLVRRFVPQERDSLVIAQNRLLEKNKDRRIVRDVGDPTKDESQIPF